MPERDSSSDHERERHAASGSDLHTGSADRDSGHTPDRDTPTGEPNTDSPSDFHARAAADLDSDPAAYGDPISDTDVGADLNPGSGGCHLAVHDRFAAPARGIGGRELHL